LEGFLSNSKNNSGNHVKSFIGTSASVNKNSKEEKPYKIYKKLPMEKRISCLVTDEEIVKIKVNLDQMIIKEQGP
jgi:hypothetical protein